MPSPPPAAAVRGRDRLDGIDALRGLAIFFVLMNHVNMRLRLARVPWTAGLPDQLVSALVWNGQHGVQIFFAVSGFLITSTALRRSGSLSRIGIRNFYRLRFARIAPLFLLLLAVLSAFHLLHVKNFVVAAKTGGLGQALFAALTFRVNVLEAQRGYLPANWDVLWSLSVEELFYFLFPLLCRLTGGRRLLTGILGVFVVLGPFGRTVLAHGNEVWREYSYLGGMDAIALGCLTALLISRVRFSGPVLRNFTVAGVALLLFSLGLSNSAERLALERSGLDMTIVAAGTCLIAIAAAQTEWRSPPLLRPLLRLGERSYEVYLTHMFVVFACFEIFLDAGKPMAAVPLFFLAVLLLSALAGILVARFYSEPLNCRLRQLHGYGVAPLAVPVRA